MKQAIINTTVLGALLAAAPVSAAIVVNPSEAADAQSLFVVDQSGPVTVPATAATAGATVDSIGNTLATYAAMLPIPTDWLLFVGGFALIGYAMRTRKRARVSFN